MNKRRTKQENVCVAFSDAEYGDTHGMFLADENSYGADRLWCLLKPIPIVLEPDLQADDATVAEAVEPAPKRSRQSASAGSASTSAMANDMTEGNVNSLHDGGYYARYGVLAPAARSEDMGVHQGTRRVQG